MAEEAIRNQEEVVEINRRFMRDEITAEEAVKLLKPIADRVNSKRKAIAKKHNVTNPPMVKPEATKSHGAKLR